MFRAIKTKFNDPKFDEAKEFAKNLATGIALGVAVKAGTYIIISGTKSLVEEIKNINTSEE